MGYAERNNPKSRWNGKRYKPLKVKGETEKALTGIDPMTMLAILSGVGRRRRRLIANERG